MAEGRVGRYRVIRSAAAEQSPVAGRATAWILLELARPPARNENYVGGGKVHRTGFDIHASRLAQCVITHSMYKSPTTSPRFCPPLPLPRGERIEVRGSKQKTSQSRQPSPCLLPLPTPLPSLALARPSLPKGESEGRGELAVTKANK